MMDLSSLTGKEKKTICQSRKVLGIQPDNDMMSSDTQAEGIWWKILRQCCHCAGYATSMVILMHGRLEKIRDFP